MVTKKEARVRLSELLRDPKQQKRYDEIAAAIISGKSKYLKVTGSTLDLVELDAMANALLYSSLTNMYKLYSKAEIKQSVEKYIGEIERQAEEYRNAQVKRT